MKHCPLCYRPYDDSLSFCLEDGKPLVSYDPDVILSMGTRRARLLRQTIKGESAEASAQDLTSERTGLSGLPRKDYHRTELCPRCGNEAPQRLVYFCECADEFWGSCGYFLFVCETCEQIILYQAFGWSMDDELEIALQDMLHRPLHTPQGYFDLEWPEEYKWVYYRSTPERVRKYCLAAQANIRRPHAYALQVREALAAICDDKQIDHASLDTRLEILGSKCKLPRFIQSAAGYLSWVPKVPAPELLPWINRLLQIVIEFIYITPDLIERYVNERYAEDIKKASEQMASYENSNP